jgi:hypothetical protein
MSRWLFEDNTGVAHGAEPAESMDDERGAAGSGASDHEARRIPRLRDDPAGRRSLTGLEFRRQRSRGK